MFHHVQSLSFHVGTENNAKNSFDEDGEEDNDIVTSQDSKKIVVPWYIIREDNTFRQFWNGILALLLIYTGTIFPYRLCFVELAIDGTGSDSDTWKVVELVVDVLFWCDLFVWFFFSFNDADGQEILSLRRIVRRYLQTYFMLNVIACIPPGLISAVIEGLANGGDGNAPVNKSARLSRLQRISRLARLARLTRLAKFFNFILESPLWKKFQSLRFIRIINFITGLFWTVHLVACGWYLTAVFTTRHEDTWLDRRGILGAGPAEQWMHANYFVLTVFTTVGFGDISAFTLGEIGYVSFTMIIGAVIHGVIMSEVINIVVQVDQADEDLSKQRELVKEYAHHTRLSPDASKAFVSFFDHNRARRHHFDKDKMQALLTSCTIPRELLGYLIHGLFGGDLESNHFITACLRYEKRMPPRFPLLVALHVNQRYYTTMEVVYCAYDSPWNLFLVLSGTFAYVAFPTENGGVSDLPQECIRIFRDKTSNSLPKVSGLSRLTSGTGSRATDAPRISGVSTKKTLDFKSMGSMINWGATKDNDGKGSSGPQASLFPYQLFGPRTYFGDIELLMRTGHTRVSSARCESEGASCASSSTAKSGHVLVLQHKELIKLMRDFVPFGLAWQSRARRRDEHRQSMMQRLTRGVKYKELAVLTIQRYVRNKDRVSEYRAKRKFSENRLRSMQHKLDHVHGENSREIIALRDEVRQALSDIRQDLRAALGQETRENTSATIDRQDVHQGVASLDLHRAAIADTDLSLRVEAAEGIASDDSVHGLLAEATETSAQIPSLTIKKKHSALL